MDKTQNGISMDVSKIGTKKIKKRDKQMQNESVKTAPVLSDMDSSSVTKCVKKQRRKNKETLKDVNLENDLRGTARDRTRIHNNEVTRKQHHQFVDCSEKASKIEKKLKSRKRKSDTTTICEDNTPAVCQNEESIKRRKLANKNAECNQSLSGDVGRHGNKKKKMKNKFAFGGQSNEIPPVRNENEVKVNLSIEDVSENEGNITLDSLDGSYLGTLGKQEQNTGGNVEKMKKNGMEKNEATVSSDIRGPCDLSLTAHTITNTTVEGVQDKNANAISGSVLPAMFLRHSLKKAKANNEARTNKERLIMVSTIFDKFTSISFKFT